MNTVPELAAADWQMRTVVPDRCIEWRKLVVNDNKGAPAVTMRPGAAIVAGNTRLLHFAPGAWLAIDYDAAAIPSELASDAIPVDVTGKWVCFSLAGALVQRVIAAGTQLKLVLENRDCAALHLFDCPVVVLRATDAFELWIHSSYADCLRTALIAAANAAANSTADD